MLAPSHPVLCSPRLRRQRWSPALGVRSAPRGWDVPRRSCKPSRRAADSDKARSRTKQGRAARREGAPARLVVALADDRSGDSASLCGGKTVAHVRPAPPHAYSTREGPMYRKKNDRLRTRYLYSAQRCRQLRGRLRLVRAGSYCRRPRTAPPSGCAAPPRGGGRTGKPNANK